MVGLSVCGERKDCSAPSGGVRLRAGLRTAWSARLRAVLAFTRQWVLTQARAFRSAASYSARCRSLVATSEYARALSFEKQGLFLLAYKKLTVFKFRLFFRCVILSVQKRSRPEAQCC